MKFRKQKTATSKWITVLAGSAFAAYGLSCLYRKSNSGMNLTQKLRNGASAFLGALNHRGPDETRFSVRHNEGIKVEKSILINKSPEELFAFWRNLENLPRFMKHIESVQNRGFNQSHWVASAPGGVKLEWDAEVHNEIPNELIAWRSLQSSDLNHAGSVHFIPVPDKHATRVDVVMSYEPPAGVLGEAVGKLLGKNPAAQIESDLNRFRELMEFGEVLTIEQEEILT